MSSDKEKEVKDGRKCKQPDVHPQQSDVWCFDHGNYCNVCYFACPVCQPDFA